MPNNIVTKDDSAVVKDSEFLNKKTKAVPLPKTKDTDLSDRGIATKIAEIGDTGQIDISAINAFTQVSQTRDNLYKMLDMMGDDPTVAAVLETYAEDATEYNDKGQIVWAESDDASISKFIEFLLESLKVDKNAYNWVYSLIKYGDIYWELFRTSEYDSDPIFDECEKDKLEQDKENKTLNEAIDINLYKKEDHYVHYIEAVSNPAEMFELTRFGKTAGFISTDIDTIAKTKDNLLTTMYRYKFNQSDINVFNGDKFVHATLDDNSSRVPEEVEIFRDTKSDDKKQSTSYKVKRGQSLLYNVFKIWREISLLENSMLLNRVTKSSITRVVSVEIGDMPKEDVRGYLAGIKQLIEQKTAIDSESNMSDYTNPGPIENNIYVPTHNGQGVITTSEVGGDVNVGELNDIDYFTNKYYGALRVPKQYFGFTDDAAGFSGGQSLALISSRYAKAVKRIQNTLIQGITDIINLMLIDKGMTSYIGKFTIKMQPPTTQEEIDRRDNTSSKVQIASDIMNLLSDVEDPATKLKVLKSLLADIITDSDVISLLEEEIAKLENEEEEIEPMGEPNEPAMGGGSIGGGPKGRLGGEESQPLDLDTELDLGGEMTPESGESEESEEEKLPSPEELGGMDFTDNDMEI